MFFDQLMYEESIGKFKTKKEDKVSKKNKVAKTDKASPVKERKKKKNSNRLTPCFFIG